MNQKQLSKRRKGIAATECAICLPILLTLTLATLEISSAIFLKETLTIAAYEGARAGVPRKSTNQKALDSAQRVLQARGIQNATVTITPQDVTQLKALDVVAVQVSAPIAGNSFFIGSLFRGSNISAVVKMRREFNE